MSVQSARDFIQRIEGDKSLRERLAAASDLKSRWRIIQSSGGDFTLEEYEQAVKELTAAASRELAPEELQEISAGAGWCACKGPHYNYLRL